MKLAVLLLAGCCALAPGMVLAASVGTPQLDYLLHCSGCHGASGAGVPERGIPRLAGEVGKLLHVPDGRAYLIQVPGVANANLSDAELARLLNWLPGRFDPAHAPAEAAPFTAEEVARLRASRRGDVLAQREKAAVQLRALGLDLDSYRLTAADP